MIGYIYLPDGIDDGINRAVQRRAADEFGGFTEFEARGGWVNPATDELTKEYVTVIQVVGADTTWLESTATWVSKRSDETEVLWACSNGDHGFEQAEDDTILGQIEREVKEVTDK